MSENESCKTCNKNDSSIKLKVCAKCRSVLYCSRECQKADWKVHKKVCSIVQTVDLTKLSPPKGLEKPIDKPFTRLEEGTWLHDRPEEDVYRLLIDAYRMRVEDDYVMEGDVDVDSLYAGNADGLRGFRRFLSKAKARSGLLPSWWSHQKQRECEALGMNDSGWISLRCAIEKSDVIEHYGDRFFPMQLRMLAESVLGRGPGGQCGAAMRAIMMLLEQSDDMSN